MKKLFSRKIFAMLAAVTLVTAALVTSCNNPIEGKVQGEQEDGFIPFDPPAGMGYIRIKVANNARTILPSLPDKEDMDYRIVVVTQTGSLPIYDSDDEYDPDTDGNGDPIPYAKLGDYPIVITPGTYKVTVTAYNSGSPAVVGFDEVENVAVSAGGKTVPITLKPNKTTGNGTFSYDIDLPSNIGAASGTATAVLAVRTYPGKLTTGIPTALQSADLVASNDNSSALAAAKTLPAGFYYVTITMTDPGLAADPPTVPVAIPPALQNRTVINILHIYQNIETTYEETLDDLNLFSYTVTYDRNGGNTLSSTSFGPYAHGSTLSLAANAPATPTYAVTTPATVFDGWARDVTNATTAAATKWSFSDDVPTPSNPTKLISPMTLYATWKQSDTLALSINWVNIAAPTFNQTYTFNQSAYYSGTTQTVDLTFTVAGYTLIDWIDEENNFLGTSVTLNNSSNTNYFSKGPHVFTALVEDTREYLDSPTDEVPNPNYHDIHNVKFTLTVAD